MTPGLGLAGLVGGLIGIALCFVWQRQIFVALDRVVDAAERIATALEQLAALPVPAPCDHPESEREYGGSMGRDQWRCACGYEHDEPLRREA